MKVIALRGDSNTGKSHTINVVYSFLLRVGYVQVPGHFDILGNPKFEDVFDVLMKNEIKVGITGMGDYVTGAHRGVGNLLQELDAIGCDVAICACHYNVRMQAAVQQYMPHHFVDKTVSAGRENDRVVNVVDAERIIVLI